jgi:hypothetical protein
MMDSLLLLLLLRCIHLGFGQSRVGSVIVRLRLLRTDYEYERRKNEKEKKFVSAKNVIVAQLYNLTFLKLTTCLKIYLLMCAIYNIKVFVAQHNHRRCYHYFADLKNFLEVYKGRLHERNEKIRLDSQWNASIHECISRKAITTTIFFMLNNATFQCMSMCVHTSPHQLIV